MKLLLCSFLVTVGAVSAVQAAQAQAAPADKAAVRAAIAEAISAGDVRRAYETYDRFAAAGGKQDADLLGPIAAEELRAIATQAVDDPLLQVNAFERLARVDKSQAVSGLQRMALSRPETAVAAMANGALVRLGDGSAAARLAAMAASSAMRDKASVAEAIGRSGSRQYAGAIVPLLSDPEWATRIQAVRALAELDYAAAIPEIRGLLTDEDPQVRSAAAIALKRLGDAGGDSQTAAMLRSDVASARLEALRADRASSPAEVSAVARQLAGDPDPYNRVKAAEALAGDDPAAAHAVLSRVADDSDVTARRLAARGLETLKPWDVALLRRLLEDQSGWVRMYAAGGVLAAADAK